MKITVSYSDDEEIKLIRKLLSPIIKNIKVKKSDKKQYNLAYIDTK